MHPKMIGDIFRPDLPRRTYSILSDIISNVALERVYVVLKRKCWYEQRILEEVCKKVHRWYLRSSCISEKEVQKWYDRFREWGKGAGVFIHVVADKDLLESHDHKMTLCGVVLILMRYPLIPNPSRRAIDQVYACRDLWFLFAYVHTSLQRLIAVETMPSPKYHHMVIGFMNENLQLENGVGWI